MSHYDQPVGYRDRYPVTTYFSKFLAVILTIALIITGLSVWILGIAQPESIEKLVMEIDLARLPITKEKGLTITFTDYVYQLFSPQMVERFDITSDNVQTMIEKSTLKPFLAKKAGLFAEDLLYATGKGKLTKKEIIDLVEENRTVIEKSIGSSLTDKEFDQFLSIFEKMNIKTISIQDAIEEVTARHFRNFVQRII